MSNDQETKEQEEYLDKFLNEDKKVESPKPEKNNTEWQDVPLETLPLGEMYLPSTRIQIRAAKIKEIQHYSTIENHDHYDVRNHLDDILNSCIKVKIPGGGSNSFLDLKVGDRLYLVLMIRELTFPGGKILSKKATCPNGHDNNIELLRMNFEYYDKTDIMNYFDPRSRTFIFETKIKDEPFSFSVPTIGTQRAFIDWIKTKTKAKEEINQAFVNIGPYLSQHKSSWTHKELDEFQNEFETQLSIDQYQFMHAVIEKFKKGEFRLGVKGLVKQCEVGCGQEVRTNQVFPDRPSDLFIVPDAFGDFIRH